MTSSKGSKPAPKPVAKPAKAATKTGKAAPVPAKSVSHKGKRG